MISQICSMTNDPKDKVSQTAFETLCIVLSKDSSTAIILNNYLDAQIYNSISERCFAGKLASVNYDGIVEFPTPQTQNSNNLLYSSSYSASQESQSVAANDHNRQMKSTDQTVYSQNFYHQSTALDDRPRVTNYSQHTFDKGGSTTSSIGNKNWLPGFNMTASSIKSEQPVRVSKEPIMQTPIQYSNKISNERKLDRNISNTVNKNLDYTPETHKSSQRRFGSVNNPSMTAHSMNVGASNMNSFGQPQSKSHAAQNEYYEEAKSAMDAHHRTEYNQSNLHKNRPTDYVSDKADNPAANQIPGKGPIKPVALTKPTSNQSESMYSGLPSSMDDDSQTEGRHHRYSQMSNKSVESRNRAKNSLSQKKPPLKGKKTRGSGSERAHSIDDREPKKDKLLSPEAQWKRIASDLRGKDDWEKQFKACNVIKDFTAEHASLFQSSDPDFGDIMAEL